MSSVRIEPACGVPPAALHAAFTAAFADYLAGPFQVPLEHWPRFLGRQAADLALSRVARVDGAVAAFALVAPRGDTSAWRLAAMGAVPGARGGGAARALLDDFIARAGAAGRSHVELECFAQNERALRLYRGRGFEPVHVLFGYGARTAESGGTPGDGPAVQAVDLQDAFGWLERAARRIDGLPLQVTPVSLRAQPVRLLAWRCGRAQLVAGESAAGQLTLYSLVDPQPGHRDAEALVAALARQFPQHTVQVPQLQRLDLGGAALERLGWSRLPLHQLWMRLPLDPGAQASA